MDMKLSEIEELLEAGIITKKTLSAFKEALKRAPKSYRCQHCYTTAASFPKRKWRDAIDLILFGLHEYETSWVDQMRAYCNMAMIYESVKEYPNALIEYRKALDAVPQDNRKSYEPELSADLLRVELHCSNFQFTDALVQYYNQSLLQDEFSRSFKHRMFYRAIADIVIHSHNGDTDQANAAYAQAKTILAPSYQGPITHILMRHRYADSAKATKEAVRFMKSCGRKR